MKFRVVARIDLNKNSDAFTKEGIKTKEGTIPYNAFRTVRHSSDLIIKDEWRKNENERNHNQPN